MAAGVDLSGFVLPSTVEETGRSDDGRRAEYILQPLERGFGHTVGNSIRRVLLSALPGSAIWAIRIDGVQHEHQTISGVAEDIHQIIQRLKRLVLVLDPDVEEAKLQMSVHAAGVVKASHIEKNPSVEVVNADLELFTLQEDLPENRPLNVEFWVNRGRGFVPAEHHEKPEDAPVDLIRIDSVYNPVVRANFRVQETRVGQRTDFDRLTFEIETDGSVDPSDAIADAAEIGRLHLDYLVSFRKRENGGPVGEAGPAEESRTAVDGSLKSVLEAPLDSFDAISVRSRNNLEKADIRTLGDVAVMTRDEMLNVPSFGEKSLEEVAEVLALNGLRFGMRIERDADGNLFIAEPAAGGDGGSHEA